MLFNSNKSRFLAGWEIDFEDEEQLKKILLTHGVDRNGMDFFRKLQTATELVIKNETIVKVIEYSQDEKKSTKVNYPLPILDWPDRSVFFLQKNEKGIHSIGGEKPINFQIPNCDKIKSPFVYIATIDPNDSPFKWLNLEKLHISYPVSEGAFKIFLDYQNPNAPIVLNPETFNYSWITGIKGLKKIEYEKNTYSIVTLDFSDVEENDDTFLLCGVPLWYQYPEIPICPKNGKVMRFVTTINSDSSIKIKKSDELENLPFNADYLIFGDYGHLYIFYEPESKVLYMDVQF